MNELSDPILNIINFFGVNEVSDPILNSIKKNLKVCTMTSFAINFIPEPGGGEGLRGEEEETNKHFQKPIKPNESW